MRQDITRKADDSALDTQSMITPKGAMRTLERDATAEVRASRTELPAVTRDVYTLGPQLARGGMGRIVAARDRRLGRVVAIKELTDPGGELAARFEREARITARLQHPAIVPIYEAGTWPDGEMFYSMKLVAGESLDKVIARTETVRERMTLLPHIIAVTEALAYAHSHRIIHRDLKPSNVLIGEFGETIVIDWGLAKNLAAPAQRHDDALDAAPDAAEHDDLTLLGRAMGTPAYMAPEQASGRTVDERADVYSLGAMLYHLLDGKRPFADLRSARTILDRVIERGPEPIASQTPEIPVDLATIVDKAMARDPGDRYSDAQGLARDLKSFQTGQMVSSHQYSTWTLLRRWVKRHRSAVVIGLVGLALTLTTAIWSVTNIIQARNDAVTALAQSTDKSHELLLLQARSVLASDPTATIAWLKQVPLDGGLFERARALYEQATTSDIARHVIARDTWISGVAFLPGDREVIAAARSGELLRVNVATGREDVIDRVAGGFSAVAVSPDGRWIAASTGLNAIRVIDRATGARHDLAMTTLVFVEFRFSRASDHLCVSNENHLTRCWALGPGGVTETLHSRWPIGITSDADRYVTTDRIGTHALKDTASGVELKRYDQLRERSLRLRFSPDDALLASYDVKGWLRVVDVATGALVLQQHMPRNRMAAPLVEWSADGQWLAATDGRWKLALWDRRADRVRWLRGHDNAIFRLRFARDAPLLVSASDDTTARVWDLRSTSVRVLRGHTDDVTGLAVSAAGDMVATCGLDNTLRLWPIQWGSSDLVGGVGAYVHQFAFTGDDALVTGSLDGEVRRWVGSSGAFTRLVEAGSGAMFYWGQISPDRRYIAMGGKDEAWLMRLSDGERIPLTAQSGFVAGASFSRDGRTLAVTQASGDVTYYATESGQHKTRSHGADLCDSVLSPDGAQFAAISLSRIDIHDVATGATLSTIHLPAPVRCWRLKRGRVVLSPDGQWLALSAQTGITLVNWHSGEVRHRDALAMTFPMMAFSPDSALLAIGHSDRTVQLWRIEADELVTLGKHDDLVMQAAFSPGGDVLATASYDHTIRLWDVHTGDVRVLRGHSEAVSRIAFSPDGSLLASTGDDLSVRMWRVHDARIATADHLRQALDASSSAVIDASNRPVTPDAPATLDERVTE